MDRLTIADVPIEGGMRRALIDARAVREEAMTIYWRLKQYEDTDLTPEQLREMDRLYLKKCQEVAALKKQQRWIPVAERLPDGGEDVLVCAGNGWILIAWYGTNGQSWHITPTGITHDDIIAWMPVPEPYRPED